MNRRDMLRAFGAAGISGFISDVLAKGDVPPGINRLEGNATVNGKPAQVGTPVSVGDKIATGRDSQAIVVVGGDAMLMRAQTTVEIQGNPGTIATMIITTGRVLTVWSKKPVAVKAATATIGIRGTGAYFEVLPDEVYFCLCYGEAVVEAPGMAGKEVKTNHHEQPLLLVQAGGSTVANPGPFRNHKDDELILLESLCGREPPFMKDGTYPAKKY
jgi:hypothetical protein